MAIVSGQLVDASGESISGLRPVMWWLLNRTTVHGVQLVVNHGIAAEISGSNFTVDLVPTAPREFYTIRVDYLDPEGNLTQWRELDRRVRVPTDGGDLSELIDLPIVETVGLIYVSPVPPPDGSRYRAWIDTSGVEPIWKEWE